MLLSLRSLSVSVCERDTVSEKVGECVRVYVCVRLCVCLVNPSPRFESDVCISSSIYAIYCTYTSIYMCICVSSRPVVCCSMLQCVAVCCSVLQCVAVCSVCLCVRDASSLL